MIRGTRRPMPRPAAAQTLDFRASIHNRFDVEVLDAVTGELKQRARGYNVICDALWDQLFSTSSESTMPWTNWAPKNYFNYILYGAGSGTPSASDTALFSQIAAIQIVNTSDVEITVDRNNSVAYGRAAVTIQAEEAVGETITEIGVGYDATHCVTHALLEDMNGNPISITKTDADVIKIYATIFLHWPAAAWYGGSVNLPNPENDGFYRTLLGRKFVSASPGLFWLAAAKSSIQTVGVYDNGSSTPRFTTVASRADKKISAAYRFPATDGRGPIRYIAVGIYVGRNSGLYFDMQARALPLLMGSWFSPPAITGEAVGTGDGTTQDFRTAFPVRSGASVKVNGAAASATVRAGAPDGTALHKWLNPVDGLNAAGVLLYPFSGYSVSDDNGLSNALGRAHTSALLENPFFAVGLASLEVKGVNIHGAFTVTAEASDDLETWTDAGSLTVSSDWSNWQSLTIPAALQTKRFFRLTYTGNTEYCYLKATVPGSAPAYNIHFDAPPAAGAVITADYVPDCIAKDENHVFDLTLELTLGEYSEG